MVDEQVAPRSFLVTSTENGKTNRQNRRQLIKLKDQQLGKTSDQPLESELNLEKSTQPVLQEEVILNQEPEREVEREADSTETTERSSQSPEEVESEGTENRKRSSWERKPPLSSMKQTF